MVTLKQSIQKAMYVLCVAVLMLRCIHVCVYVAVQLNSVFVYS